ncbi:MAG: 50S ribosomal protein L40e [Candidatus Aenigmatarchaeota archaeon]|nr:50S ribosomal protein L40e [Candidatus Aenigmarchaeota archaeon]
MPRQKIDATYGRIYNRQYVCMKCNAKIKTDAERVAAGKVKCRKCGYKGLRQKSKERKV